MNQRDNRTHRKQNKDKVIMIVSSAFVLMALTMTGIYMKDKKTENLDEDYSIDFTKEVEDEEEDFVVDTEYVWNENDRVSVKIPKDKIKLKLKAVNQK